MQGCCAGGRAIQTTLPRDIKRNRAATVTATAAAQQQCNSTSASNSGLCDSHGAFCVRMCVQCSPGDICTSYKVPLREVVRGVAQERKEKHRAWNEYHYAGISTIRIVLT